MVQKVLRFTASSHQTGPCSVKQATLTSAPLKVDPQAHARPQRKSAFNLTASSACNDFYTSLHSKMTSSVIIEQLSGRGHFCGPKDL
ncbi:hypothetical protein DPMN_147398 [Dreissena polymorpha]|uniref:Uncharacterized protein n=1 Tax=Dreissena polymorpha TaxID=45954 RepID=A0A9D4FC46_DREPO|nr:hypothetical protein DPMN_147398 [Dreissena polymorpha]